MNLIYNILELGGFLLCLIPQLPRLSFNTSEWKCHKNIVQIFLE